MRHHCLIIGAALVASCTQEPPPTKGGAQGVQDHIAALLERFASDSVGERMRATQTAVELGAYAVPMLVKKLDDGDARVRLCAAASLGGIGSAAGAATAKLLHVTNDADADVGRTARMALCSVALGSLETLVGSLASTDVREAAIGTIDAIGNQPALAPLLVPRLIAALDHTDADIRLEAAALLGNMREAARSAAPALLARLKNEREIGVQIWIVVALGRMGATAAVAELRPLLAHSDARVRGVASEAIERIQQQAP